VEFFRSRQSPARGPVDRQIEPSVDEQIRRDADHVISILASLHRAAAGSALRGASSEGVFPGGLWVEPLPVVVDTNWLRGDIRHACLNQRRTVLITAANEQFIRVYCAEHVVEEVVEHAAEFSAHARRPIRLDDFLGRFRDEYLPMLRVVPDHGVPDGWLSPAEAERIATLQLKDRDDVPSVKLALALRALYVSTDGPALRAVYGNQWELAAQRQWVDYLKAGGDIGQLQGMMYSVSGAGWLLASGGVAVARRLCEWVGIPVAVAGAVALGVGFLRWVRGPSGDGVRTGGVRLLNVLAATAELVRERRRQLDAALPAPPDAGWAAPADAHTGRELLKALARDSTGERSAQEMSAVLRGRVPCNDKQVRRLLRSTACFVEVYRGRWQVGSAMHMRPPAELPRTDR
jgi:predicted nucleic acid-binding protein